MKSKQKSVSSILSLAAFLAFVPHVCADYPIASHRYLADPGTLVHKDRVYIYCSNDDENPVEGGYQMSTLVCVSSSDMKNWTDHGVVFKAPDNASWAKRTWAPGVIERDGKLFLYFGNGGSNIGVASSASPTGPFTDPRGGFLINSQTPGVLPAQNMWLFDPAPFIDDDGQAYLYFGGNGDNNARVIKLNRDMISLDGPAMAMTVPNFFEAAWMHKRNGVYYFSYSTTPAAQMRIDYLTSDKPTGGFTHRGAVAAQPPMNDNNNHAAIFQFKGEWYHAYHNRYVARQAGIPPVYKRNLAVERLRYNEDGAIQPVTYTTDGVPQVGHLDPYVRVEGETFNAQSGIETEPCSEGGMNVRDIRNGDWIKIKGVDFGRAGAREFTSRVASATRGGKIELRVGSPEGALIGACEVPGTGGEQIWKAVTCAVTGTRDVQDLYLKFTGDAAGGASLFSIDWWRFAKAN